MGFRKLIRKIFELSGYTVQKIRSIDYCQDGLQSKHNHDFMLDPNFCKAYQRGVLACAGEDYRWHWRVHIGLWAAYSASKLDGDFIECGVNKGFLSSAIMEYLNWNSINKTFFLMDTFCGIDEKFVSKEELANGILEKSAEKKKSGFYSNNVDLVKKNFYEWKNIQIIEGPIPETLNKVVTNKVAYLHIDMNCAPPEVAAFNFFWEKLVPGGIVLFDDYAYKGHKFQKEAIDATVAMKGVKVASLPTGQGLLIKPF